VQAGRHACQQAPADHTAAPRRRAQTLPSLLLRRALIESCVLELPALTLHRPRPRSLRLSAPTRTWPKKNWHDARPRRFSALALSHCAATDLAAPGAPWPCDKCQAVLHQARTHFTPAPSRPCAASLHLQHTLGISTCIQLRGHILYGSASPVHHRRQTKESKWSKLFNIAILNPPSSLPLKTACEHATSLPLPLCGGESLSRLLTNNDNSARHL
jgi:hypothetical protein